MVHTVGIYGARGNVGAPTLKYLAEDASAGKIKLIVFHREGSKPDSVKYGGNIESRVFDLQNDSIEKITSVTKGVEVFVATIGFDGMPSEPKLPEALSKTGDLVTYIPSAYSTTWHSEDFANPAFKDTLNGLYGGLHKAKELGLGVTKVYCGVFDNYWFELEYLRSSLKKNFVVANEKQLQNPFPFTDRDHLGKGIAKIAAQDPQTIKNREYSVVSFMPTGQEFVDIYTKLNGKKCTVKDFTKSDWQAILKDVENEGPVKAGYLDRWEKNSWTYSSGGKIEGVKYSGPSLEEIAKPYL